MPMKTSSFIASDAAPTGKANKTTAITITGTNLICVAINTVREGWLSYLGVVQSSGTPCAYTVDLYDSVLPYAVGLAPVATGLTSGVLASTYEVIPQQSVTSGNSLRFRGGYGYNFGNVDAESGIGNAGRTLYLVIKPTGAAGTTKWDVRLNAVTEIGN